MTGFWKILKGVFLYALLASFFVVAVLSCAILFFEQNVPTSVLERLTASLGGTNMLVTAESASFRFTRGLRVRNVRVFDRSKSPVRGVPAEPMLSAAEVDLGLDLLRLPWRWERMLKRVEVTRLRYPRLPEGYYIPDSIEFPGQPDFKERNEPIELDLPALRAFEMRLVRPEVLGLSLREVDCPRVCVTRNGIRFEGLHLVWPDQDARMALNGGVELDLAAQRVRGEVRGLARQHGIRPMLEALEITNSYQFIDAFTEVGPPVESGCRFDVDLRTGDLRIHLDLHPPSCRHHGVPVKDVEGPLDIRVFVRDTYKNARIVVGPLHVELGDGTRMEGTVVYENTNDVGFVDFDTKMGATLKNALAIADVMNDGTLDCLRPETPPEITLKGRMAVDPAHAELNDLKGRISFEKGTLLSVKLRKAMAEFHAKGTDVVFTNAVAMPPSGGSVQGGGWIRVPGGRRSDAHFRVDLKGDAIALKDLAEMFGVNAGDRHGVVNGTLWLEGPLETNAVARLNGGGRIDCRNGQLAQMKFFAGLTDILSKRVPVLAEHAPVLVGLVNQSRASLDFTLTNGVLRTSNACIEGGTLSVDASGTYDIVKDNLDFRVRVTFTRDESFFSTLATPITWPFANLTKRIFEFRIGGTLDDPRWSFNANLMDRLRK